MVHLEERDGHLKIKRDKLAPAKRPAVCIAFVGGLFIVAGAMQIGVSAQEHQASSTALQVVGPICLIIGVLLLVAGFFYKYIVHHKAKEKAESMGKPHRSKNYIVTVRRGSRPSTAKSRPGSAASRPQSSRASWPGSRGSTRPPSSAASVNTVASNSTCMTSLDMDSPPSTSRPMSQDMSTSSHDLPGGYDIMYLSSDDDCDDAMTPRGVTSPYSARSHMNSVSPRDTTPYDIFTASSLVSPSSSLNSKASSPDQVKSSDRSKLRNKSKTKSKSSKLHKSRVQSEVVEKPGSGVSTPSEQSTPVSAATLKSDGTPSVLSTGLVLTVNSVPIPGQDETSGQSDI